MRKLLTIGVVLSISLSALTASADMKNSFQRKALTGMTVPAKKIAWNMGSGFEGKEQICKAFRQDSTQVYIANAMAYAFNAEEDMKEIIEILTGMTALTKSVIEFCDNKGNMMLLEANAAPDSLKSMADKLVQTIDKALAQK